MARTLGIIADEVLAKQLKRKKLEDQVDLIKKEEEVLKAELKLAADAESLTLGGGKKSKWTIEPQIVPQAQDWDAFYGYIAKEKYFHLLQRRPAVKACQELWGQGIVIPGIEKFTSMKVSVKAS